MKLGVVVLCLAVTYARADAQRECSDHAQCTEKQFCAELVGKCTECVPCDEYKRAPSDDGRGCAESVEDCGDCLQGFKKLHNRQECVDEQAPAPSVSPEPDGGGRAGVGEGGLPVYVWLPILLVVLAVLAVFIVCLVRWRTNIFSTTTRENIFSTSGADAERPLRAASPPPHDFALRYNNAVNNNHQPSSPPYEKSDDDMAGHRPFIMAKDVMNESAGKEQDNSQEARPFNYPNYVRPPHPPPPSYDEALGEESNPAAEEETVPSAWSPHPASGGSTLSLSEQLNEARVTQFIRQPERSRSPSPPAKQPRLLPAEGSAEDEHEEELATSPGSAVRALPAATDVGSNLIPLTHAARVGAAPNTTSHRAERAAGGDRPGRPGRPVSPPTPPPTPPHSAQPRNIVINITQQLNNVVAPRVSRYESEQR